MCTVVVQTSPFFLLSNRDEFLDRPAAPLDHWEGILAGRDLRSGGAWLGFGPRGRWAVLTNLPGAAPPNPPTRGQLVQNFLTGQLSPEDYAQSIPREQYAGFNLLVGKGDQLTYLSNQAVPRNLPPGLHVLGNTPIQEETARTQRARQLVLDSQARTPEDWLELFHDPLVWIELSVYGTRCTTLAQLSGKDLSVWERSRGHSEIRRRDWPNWLF